MAPPETPKPAEAAPQVVPDAAKAAPAIAIQGPPEAAVAEKAAEARKVERDTLKAELAQLKGQTDLLQTTPMLKDFAPPAFLYNNEGATQFKTALRQKVLQGLIDKQTPPVAPDMMTNFERLADLRVKYVEKTVAMKLCDPTLSMHPYTVTVTFDASGEAVIDLRPDAETEKAAKDAAAKGTPKDPAKEPTDAEKATEAKYAEFAKGSYGGMAKLFFGMLDPRGSSETPEDYNKRLDAKLRETFKGENMLGMLFCLVGIVPRDGVFYKDMLDKPWAKKIEESVREAFKALGISPEKVKDVADNQAFQELMKEEKTHEGNFSLKGEVVVPPGMVLTVEKFKAGVFANGAKMDKPGSPGAPYDPDKVEEKQTFVAGVKFPPGTMLAGVTVKKAEAAKPAPAEQPAAQPVVAAAEKPEPTAPAAPPVAPPEG